MSTPIESMKPGYAGNITVSQVWEELPGNVVNIIRTDQDWGVDLQWEMTGYEAHYGIGIWLATIFLESMGPGREYALPSPGPVKIANKEGSWDMTKAARVFSLIPDKLPLKVDHTIDPIDPGTYRLTVAIQYFNFINEPESVAGFMDGPMLQFYKPAT
jgi:hypothetical protein